MPQYIQNPSLMGMQEANEQSKQRTNIYAQAIASAADAINRQAMADLATLDKMRMARDFIEAGFSPQGQELVAPKWRAPMKQFGQATVEAIQQRQNAMAGYNPIGKTQAERETGYSFVPSFITPGATPDEIMRQRIRLAPYFMLTGE